ncbi:deaminated glutathione amidase [Jejubacter calystegiae]|uniref:Deaminated glutathione amidase n=1 Tax=Jejubacter calystegiae TaxID=2579935 RepID=A0A4V1G7R0_9ENTR|nr:deaminated glutathione amidase [Jejubacter calystegiae]QCT20517.1 deaminated glutathione amidase [Jejubacter calystegiae]
MKVAVGQFAVTPDVEANLAACCGWMAQADAQQVDLLVLPEAVLARSDSDSSLAVKAAQPLEGPFVSGLLAAGRGSSLTTVLTLHVPTGNGRAANTLVALRNGEIVASYQKLHLYDAFKIQESLQVDAGHSVAPLIEVAGMKVGLLTCYDLRFPELAMSLALAGAQVLALPAAWVRGGHKERHWELLLAARALDTTCYVAAADECGARNIGLSRVVDPLGVTLAGLGEQPGMVCASLSQERLAEVRASLPVLANRRFAAPRLV